MLKGAIFDLEILLTEKIHQWLKSMGYFLEQIRASFVGFKKNQKCWGLQYYWTSPCLLFTVW